jgi:hypothetical protein
LSKVLCEKNKVWGCRAIFGADCFPARPFLAFFGHKGARRDIFGQKNGID